MPNGGRVVSHGVARRNAKLRALRELVSLVRTVLVVDLASKKRALGARVTVVYITLETSPRPLMPELRAV